MLEIIVECDVLLRLKLPIERWGHIKLECTMKKNQDESKFKYKQILRCTYISFDKSMFAEQPQRQDD